MASLASSLEKLTCGNKRAEKIRRYIVVEAIYQNSGQVAPLDEIVRLKEKYRFRLILEESHSFGVIGNSGRGLAEYYGVPIEKIDIITAGMGNALATDGGFCTGSIRVVDHQRLSSSAYVFSASLPPYLASAAISAVDYLEENPSVLTTLRNNIALLWKGLSDVPGLEIASHPLSPIIFLKLKKSTGSPKGDLQLLEQIAKRKREKLAKESRAKQKYTHTSGSKSFARKEKEIENTVGRVPGLVEMFELTHTKKNGSFISEEAKKLMADAKEKLASCSGTSESSRECMIAMENKIYIEIIRKEYGGRVGGLGMIPFESCVCYHSESIEEVQKLREEVQENKKMVSQLQSQLAVVMEFIRQKMPDCNLGGSSHDPESSGVRCTSASSNRSTDS